MTKLSVLKRRTRGWIEDILGRGFGRTDDGKGFGKHTLETRVRVQVNRGHETCMGTARWHGEKRTSEGDPLDTHMTATDACESRKYAKIFSEVAIVLYQTPNSPIQA